jgi:hypothetical protein
MGALEIATERSFAYRLGTESTGQYFVLLHTSAAPDATSWNAYVENISRVLGRASGSVHAIVVTDGGGPDAGQRKHLADAFEQGDAMTHVFTTDMFVRGIVTAFRWITKARATAHAPDDFDSICERCGLSGEMVLRDLESLQDGMAKVRTLELIRNVGEQSRRPRIV